MDAKLVAAARSAFPADGSAVVLGAPLYAGECHPAALNRDSAAEKLERKNAPAAAAPAPGRESRRESRAARGSSVADMLNSPLARTVAGAITRGLMGALLGPARRRRRY